MGKTQSNQCSSYKGILLIRVVCESVQMLVEVHMVSGRI